MLKKAPHMGSRWPSWSQLGLKMAILAPTWSILAPSWRQFGAILAHLGEIFVDPSPAKIGQNQPRQLLRDFSSQGRPQELPDPLQTLIFQDLRTIFDTFFVNLSKHFSFRFCFKVYMCFLNFLWERSSRKVPKGRGRRYSPAGRLRFVFISYTHIYIYIYICIYTHIHTYYYIYVYIV